MEKNNGCDSDKILKNIHWKIQLDNRQYMNVLERKRKTTNTTASVTTNEVNPKQNRLVATIINRVKNVSRQEHLKSTQMILYQSNGSQITVAENWTNDNNFDGNNDTSIIIYDHLGNPLRMGHSDIKYIIKKVSVAWKHYSRILQSDVSHINT